MKVKFILWISYDCILKMKGKMKFMLLIKSCLCYYLLKIMYKEECMDL